jgi:hypothetical protein
MFEFIDCRDPYPTRTFLVNYSLHVKPFLNSCVSNVMMSPLTATLKCPDGREALNKTEVVARGSKTNSNLRAGESKSRLPDFNNLRGVSDAFLKQITRNNQ